MIDCEAFQNCEIDALYSDGEARELDQEASAAMTAHAAGCAECAARLEKLRKTRGLVLSVAVEAVPNDFESRIMAAVDAGMARRAAVIPIGRAAAPSAGARAPSAAAAPEPEGGAKILKLMSRPSFAVAATFVLVIGSRRAHHGAQRYVAEVDGRERRGSRHGGSARGIRAHAGPDARRERTRRAARARRAGRHRRRDLDGGRAARCDGTAAGRRRLRAERRGPRHQRQARCSCREAGGDLAAPATDPAARAAPSKATAGKAGASSGDARAFAAAKSLYNAGRYAEALPKFEALSATNPEADLYAARCIARTRGCAAAEARYDTAAQTNAGTETGSRAQLEGARCYQSTGDVVAARKRYSAAKDEGLPRVGSLEGARRARPHRRRRRQQPAEHTQLRRRPRRLRARRWRRLRRIGSSKSDVGPSRACPSSAIPRRLPQAHRRRAHHRGRALVPSRRDLRRPQGGPPAREVSVPRSPAGPRRPGRPRPPLEPHVLGSRRGRRRPRERHAARPTSSRMQRGIISPRRRSRTRASRRRPRSSSVRPSPAHSTSTSSDACSVMRRIRRSSRRRCRPWPRPPRPRGSTKTASNRCSRRSRSIPSERSPICGSSSSTPRPRSIRARTWTRPPRRWRGSTDTASPRSSIATSSRTGCSMHVPTATRARPTRATTHARTIDTALRSAELPLEWLMREWVAPALR